MSKDAITDYSATADSNSDVGGVGIVGTVNKISNLDNAIRTVMKHLAEMNAGTSPLADTFSVADPADLTKKVRTDAGNVPTGTTVVLSAPAYSGTIATLAGTETLTNKTIISPVLTGGNAVGEIVETIYTTGSGTWTKPLTLIYLEVIAVGGGGGGGGIDGQGSGTGGAGAGGGGGALVRKLYAASALSATESYSVGAAGTGGTAGANDGTAGGNTTFSSLSAGGGAAGTGMTATAVILAGGVAPVAGGTATGGDYNIDGGSGGGSFKITGEGVICGTGGNSLMGQGGVNAFKSNDAGTGANAKTGYGGGGAGGQNGAGTGTNYAGGNGASGILILRHYVTPGGGF